MRRAEVFAPPSRALLGVAVPAAVLSAPVEAWACAGPFGYVGPGAGLSMLGALAAVAAVILLGLLAPILYPIKLLRRWRRAREDRRRAKAGAGEAAEASPADAHVGRSGPDREAETALCDPHLVDRG